MQLQPHPALKRFVRHYLVLDALQPANGMHRLFADGNTGLVFNLNNAVLCAAGSRPADHACWLYGQVKTYHDLSLTGRINWIVVVLQPYGAYPLWGVPGTEWNNCFFAATEILGAHISDISNALIKAKDLPQRICLLDQYLLQLVDQKRKPDEQVIQAVQHIMMHEGAVSVEALTKALAISERSLERKFNLHIGIAPKRLADIVRLGFSAKRMQRMQSDRGFTGIAYDSGYYDQAHFINEFKKYTGITPQQYHARLNPLALNFLAL